MAEAWRCTKETYRDRLYRCVLIGPGGKHPGVAHDWAVVLVPKLVKTKFRPDFEPSYGIPCRHIWGDGSLHGPAQAVYVRDVVGEKRTWRRIGSWCRDDAYLSLDESEVVYR